MTGYLLLHFTAVVLYAFPGRSTTSKSYILSYVYIYPWFHQSWSLFVPPPKQNFNLYVRYRVQGQQREWRDLFAELNAAHQKNRFSGEALLLAFSNSLRYYATSAKEQNEVFSDKTADLNFSVLEKITEAYLSHAEKSPLANLEIIVRIKYTDAGNDHSHYYKPSLH
ncbi:MAG: DUF5819 family protein [Bacteroidia bacterium]